ncbi:MAG: ParB N-terminal domain-containing protein [Bacteriovoracaceae bacterium]|nr:ParB N-terminal domain-containing protein [Bacteriovoracaceae bacterium]
MAFETLNLDQIKMENPYLRLGTDVSTLERSIEAIGLIAPLIVNQDNVLLAGARRWQALKNLGHTDAPVIRVEKDGLQQELISIDENLVRKALNSTEMEKHLLRAKDIYKELAGNDDMFKETLIQKRRIRLENEGTGTSVESSADELDIDTLATEEFANEVSEKSGLSKRQVIMAMEREEKSSETLRGARANGEISVSQANELIRLRPEEQEEILPHIGERTVGELRKIVKEAKANGVQVALNKYESVPNARELNELLKLMKKSFKITEALKIEGVNIQGPIRSDLKNFWEELKNNMAEVLDNDYEVFTPEYMQDNNSNESNTSSFS